MHNAENLEFTQNSKTFWILNKKTPFFVIQYCLRNGFFYNNWKKANIISVTAWLNYGQLWPVWLNG